MEYVKMPELLTAETVKAFAGNTDAIREVLSARNSGGVDNSAAGICCPRKVKFILFLNNVVIINENAIAEYNNVAE